ncbi:plexin A3-like, partial [Centruroides vittatus]|uniref:plexin A3-like n=1 Tax=Centruroides vittatus TaxID=120091 RepID=UPI00350E9C40
MGPREDSPNCPVTRVCPDKQKLSTNYYNKVLAIDYSQSKLIACGSLFQGVCTSHDVENVTLYETPANESVVANNSTASTVAFIAPGPEDLSRTHVLYVGVSYTGNGPYCSDIPAVSSRSLDPANMFAIAHTDAIAHTGTKIMINSMSREIYPIKYVFGFSAKGFSYFITVQGKQTSSPKPFISKLIRICQNDVHYYSYTEVPLECRADDGTHYNLAQAGYVGHPGSELAVSLGITAQDDVLYVVFAKSKNDSDTYFKPSANSALCVYALSAIHRKFTQNIQDCFNGVGQRGLDFINPSQACSQTQVQIKDDFCGLDVNTPLGGTNPVKASPVLRLSGVLLTAVAAISTHDYTVAFLGTSTGHLKKAVVESVTRAFEYSDIVIDEGSSVNPDMLFHKDKHIYVMTENRVTMMKVQGCHIFNTCNECLGAKDPYCGWCSLENKCSLRSDCEDAAQNANYWLSYKNGKCTTITEVQPPQIQRTTARILTLIIDNLPVLEGQFFCAFTIMGKTLTTNATRSTNGITCATPHTDSLPSIPPGQHHITAKLSVRKRIGPEFVSTNFTFYDCNTHTSCTQCVSSPFPCDWCVQGHRCTHDTGENCRNDILVTGVSSIGPSIRSGPGFCPRINTTNGSSPVILVPSGENKSIEVKVENTQPLLLQTTFVCQFNIEGRVRQVHAQFIGENIHCEPMMFSFGTQSPNVTASFAVIWAGSKPLDNPENIRVLVYRCEGMATNCGICLELHSKYKCGWCSDGIGSCRVRGQCNSSLLWLDSSQTCPNPQITKFTPISGPWEGGTNITITGINLGRTFADINGGVKIVQADEKVIANCIPYKELYEKTTTIVCQVESLHNVSSGLLTGQISGYVFVKVLNDYKAQSTFNYSFVNPRIINITPSAGPKSGGTHLLIWGRHMDAGSSVEACVGCLPCHIIRREPEVAECITSPAHNVKKGTVRMKFDNGLRVYEKEFEYVDNPTISSIESGPSGQRGIPKGIP